MLTRRQLERAAARRRTYETKVAPCPGGARGTPTDEFAARKPAESDSSAPSLEVEIVTDPDTGEKVWVRFDLGAEGE